MNIYEEKYIKFLDVRYMDNLRPHKRNIEDYSNDFTNNIYEYMTFLG